MLERKRLERNAIVDQGHNKIVPELVELTGVGIAPAPTGAEARDKLAKELLLKERNLEFLKGLLPYIKGLQSQISDLNAQLDELKGDEQEPAERPARHIFKINFPTK